ncbi:MAG: hypothetical protein IJR59_04195 [Firmicutes bacterium]|nr:hypothetical protein [Bacillota bacterium]
MTVSKKRRIHSITAMILAVVMVLTVCPFNIFADEPVIQGNWTIVNNGNTYGEATYAGLDATYYSTTTNILCGVENEMDYVTSANSNGAAKDGIVTTEGKSSYLLFKPAADGTFKVHIKNAATKTGFVSKTKDGVSTAVAKYVPGGTDNYDTEDFKIVQGDKFATVYLEVEAGTDYYITLTGSKMRVYEPSFVPYTKVSGTITDQFNIGSYDIKFVNKETGVASVPTVTGNSYSITLKPGTYSAALKGEIAKNYAISANTRNVVVEGSTTATPLEQTADLTIEQSVSYTVSGEITGLEGSYEDMKIIFVSADQASHEDVEATLNGTSYSAQLAANESYSVKLEGAMDYELAGEVVVSNDNNNPVTQNIALKTKDTYTFTGGFILLGDKRGEYKNASEEISFLSDPEVTVMDLTFENVEDGYVYRGKESCGKYTVNLRNGSYIASIGTLKTGSANYTTSTHIVVDGKDGSKDLLLKKESTLVGYTHDDVFYVGEDKEFKTVQAAVDAIDLMGSVQGDGEKPVTVKIDPGVYREQVVVNRPNITFESNGGDASNTKITWYYGIGYKYYSCVNSYYDPYADYDKFDKGDVVSYWGSAVILQKGAANFKAEGITFENSFNKYMTDEEIADGAEPNGREAITVARKENTNVDTKASTERAAALVNYADKVEFKNCSFIGSQDTLYTSNAPTDAYFKNCYIEGQTDFIYGNGDVIFDACELNFCGYDGTAAAGYLTAQSSSATNKAEDGYIFRNCYVSYNSERMTAPGTYGRMWGDNATVAFINTVLQEKDMIQPAGWTEMSGKKPTDEGMTLVEYNTTYNGQPIDTTGRLVPAKETLDESKYTVESVFINKGWTPVYYTPEAGGKAAFKTMPTMTSNGDLNTPNPGETVIAAYALEDAYAPNDVSKIEWYAVSEGYDASSLESILKSASVLKTSTAASSNSIQIPMDAAGKYLMVVVTPMATGSEAGDAAYYIDTEKPVSDVWNDPSDPDSIAPGSGINIYLAGDSTVKDYSANGMYNKGSILSSGSWGEFLQAFFDEKYVQVNDYAQGGRSSRSFINESKLENIKKNIKSGDYLFVQFGHNDCANQSGYTEERFVPLYTPENPSGSSDNSSNFPTVRPVESMKTASPASYTSTYGDTYYAWNCGATYKGYMQEYIEAALEAGATPVIVTPVARMYYDENGKITPHHDAKDKTSEAKDYTTTNNAYVTACFELYEENKDRGALLIDAFGITKTMFEDAYSECGSAALGTAIMDKSESTHSNKTGGIIQAGYIAKELKGMDISLSKYVKSPAGVYGEEPSGEFIFTVDKEGKFTAKDKNLVEQPYWEGIGQALFDSLSEAEPEPEPEPTPDGIQTFFANVHTDENNKQSFVVSGALSTLDYLEVGFIFECNGKTAERSTDTVYSSTDDASMTAADFGQDYMYSFSITDFAEGTTQIKVTPYAVDLDGNRIVGHDNLIDVNVDDKGEMTIEFAADNADISLNTASSDEEGADNAVEGSEDEQTSDEVSEEVSAETSVKEEEEKADSVIFIDDTASEGAFIFESEEQKEAS